MERLSQKLLRPLPATLIAALLGAVVGYTVGRTLVLNRTHQKLEHDAAEITGTVNAYMEEMHSILGVLNASGSPRCSRAEMKLTHNLVFHAKYVRDAGRMEGGRIVCSAMLGPEGYARREFQPDIVKTDGMRLYRNLEPYAEAGKEIYALRQGDFFVVRDPQATTYMRGINPYLTLTLLNMATGRWGQLNGEPLPIPTQDANRDGAGRLGDRLYVTRCMAQLPGCITTYASASAEMKVQRVPIAGTVAVGAVGAAFLGLVLASFFERRRGLVEQLRRAIRRGGLHLLYQPIMDLSTRRTVGAEALARWRDREGNAVSPEVFIPLAEQNGLIRALTRQVLKRALKDLSEFLHELPAFRLSLNVTAADLGDPLFLRDLSERMHAAGIAPRHLAIEITEGSTARGTAAAETLLMLRDAGYSVHIDDFGTGYSSLSYLQDLAIDAIKIDRCFTQAVGTGAASMAVLPRVLAMADALHLLVIVEGIETETQARYFLSTGQPLFAQGWLFGHPMTAKDMRQRLRQEREAEACETEKSGTEG